MRVINRRPKNAIGVWGGVGPLVCAVSESPLRPQIFFGQILNRIHLIINIAIWMDTKMCCHLLFWDFF
jgi:hypothetical protein